MTDRGLRRVVFWVALLNLTYFGIEFSVARVIGSVSLFADSIDFLEDASIDLLILVALGWTAGNRARVGRALAFILLIPGVATLWTVKFNVPSPPALVALSVAGVGALADSLLYACLPNTGRVRAALPVRHFCQLVMMRLPMSPLW